MTDLFVETAIVNDECVLTLTGDIDVSCSDKIGDLGVGTLEARGIRRLGVDMSAVTFIDSTGLGALVRIQQTAWEQGKTLTLRNPSEVVSKLLSLGALDTVITIDHAAEPAR